MILIHSTVCMKCENAIKPFPEENGKLLEDIKKLCYKTGYQADKIGLIQANSGDLHANAVC